MFFSFCIQIEFCQAKKYSRGQWSCKNIWKRSRDFFWKKIRCVWSVGRWHYNTISFFFSLTLFLSLSTSDVTRWDKVKIFLLFYSTTYLVNVTYLLRQLLLLIVGRLSALIVPPKWSRMCPIFLHGPIPASFSFIFVLFLIPTTITVSISRIQTEKASKHGIRTRGRRMVF